MKWLVWTMLVFAPTSWVEAEVYYLPGDCFYASSVSIVEELNVTHFNNSRNQISLNYFLDDDSQAGLGGYQGFDRLVINDGESLWTSLKDVVQKERKGYLNRPMSRWYPVIILDKDYDLEKFGIGNKYTQIQDFKDLILKTGETTHRGSGPTKVSQPTFHTYEYITTELKYRDQVPLLKCEIPQNTNWFRRAGGGFDAEKEIDVVYEEPDKDVVSQPLSCNAEDVQVIVLLNCDLRHHFDRKNGGILCVIKQDQVRYFEWWDRKLEEIQR